jgi:uncharacterized phiE125 gp8 family phage protein
LFLSGRYCKKWRFFFRIFTEIIFKMRQIKINSTTGNEILTASDVKNYVRIDTSADDSLITRMITQAREWCENYISRDIVAKNRTYYLSQTEAIIDIPFGPIASISTVTAEGNTAAHTVKGLDNERIELDGGSAKDVKITYVTAGLSDDLIKNAMLQFISTLYDNRSDYKTGTIVQDVPTETKALLTSYKTMFV